MALNSFIKKVKNEEFLNCIGIGHFYFHYIRKGEQTVSDVAARILKQIVNQTFTPSETSENPEALEKLFENSKKDIPPQSPQIIDLCIEYSKRFRKMYIFIDALDEVEADEQRDEIIFMLKNFANNGMKVLLMSQGHYLQRVECNFREAQSITFSSLHIVGQFKDWRKFIQRRLERERNIHDLEPYIDNLLKDHDGS
jgi:archaellum biogenesis ATPase FlaH